MNKLKNCPICKKRKEIRNELDAEVAWIKDEVQREHEREKLRTPYEMAIQYTDRGKEQVVRKSGFTDRLKECPNCSKAKYKIEGSDVVKEQYGNVVGSVVSRIDRRTMTATAHKHMCPICGWHAEYKGGFFNDALGTLPNGDEEEIITVKEVQKRTATWLKSGGKAKGNEKWI